MTIQKRLHVLRKGARYKVRVIETYWKGDVFVAAVQLKDRGGNVVSDQLVELAQSEQGTA